MCRFSLLKFVIGIGGKKFIYIVNGKVFKFYLFDLEG